MPREVFELTPPQLEWLIENQSLNSGEALDESSKMGSYFGGSFGPPANYQHQHHHHHQYHHQQQQHQQHHHQSAYHQQQHPHMDAYASPEMPKNENMHPHHHSSHHAPPPPPPPHHDAYQGVAPMEEDRQPSASRSQREGSESMYPHRIGKLTWEQSFENLKIYHKMNGHCNVPRYYSDHPQLGSWVHRQRLKRKSPKKYGFLSDDQIQQLDDIGFCWQLRGEGKERYVNVGSNSSSS